MPSLIEGKGSVVLASSVNGVLGIGEAAYSCAKAALHPLAMNIATAYGKHGQFCHHQKRAVILRAWFTLHTLLSLLHFISNARSIQSTVGMATCHSLPDLFVYRTLILVTSP